jgi:surface polysaccharide O-acyltransferase-like enzyme
MELTSYSSQFVFENLFVIFSIVILLFIPRYSKIFWDIDSSYNSINTKRLKSIDAIKGMAIISVILIHTCYLLLYKYNGTFEIVTLNFINNISRFAIPIFLFNSGLLLKPFIWRKEYILNFYISKFIRIGVPFILINIILWQIGYNKSDTLWKLIFTGDMAVPFYFIPILFQLYLLYPLLDLMRKINPKYLLLGSLIISIISFFIPATWYLYNFPLATQYLVFFVYGMLRKDILSEKISNIWRELILIYVILNAIFIISMLYNNLATNTLKLLYFYNFQLILGFGFIFIVFKYLQSHKFGSQTTNSIFAPIGKISLWIFLIHFPIQQLLFINIIGLDLPLSITLIHNFILTSLTSIVLAFILAKIYDIPKTIILNFTKK